MPHIMLCTGEVVDVTDVEAGQKLNNRVLSQSLARMPRFAGQTTRPYSVAGHTIFCAGLADDLETFAQCTLHDSAEAIMGDMPRPVKKLMPEFRDTEEMLLYRIFAAYRSDAYPLTLPLLPVVKRIDNLVLAIEASQFMPGWHDENEYWAEQRELINRYGIPDIEYESLLNAHRMENTLNILLVGILTEREVETTWGVDALTGTEWVGLRALIDYTVPGMKQAREMLKEKGFYDAVS